MLFFPLPTCTLSFFFFNMLTFYSANMLFCIFLLSHALFFRFQHVLLVFFFFNMLTLYSANMLFCVFLLSHAPFLRFQHVILVFSFLTCLLSISQTCYSDVFYFDMLDHIYPLYHCPFSKTK